MQAITTTWQVPFDTSILFTISKFTVGYQYMYSSCYRKIHLLRFLNFYCTSIYKKYFNLLGFIFPSSQNSAYFTNNYHKTLLITQILNQFLLWYFQRSSFTADTESTPFSKDSTAQTQQTKKDVHTEKILKYGALFWFVRSFDILLQQEGANVKQLFG